jgi:hypothetical protein
MIQEVGYTKGATLRIQISYGWDSDVDHAQIKVILKEAITPEDMSPQIALNLVLYEPLDSSADFISKSVRYSICNDTRSEYATQPLLQKFVHF